MEQTPLGDLCQNSHRLSFSGDVISFNCKPASLTNKSELVYCCFSYEQQGNVFLKAAQGAAVIGSKTTSAHFDIVKCRCATDVQRRVSTPCVLVTKGSEKKESFRYSLFTLSSSNTLQPCVNFRLPYDIKESVSILHGPTVLWTHAGHVFYTSPQAGGEVRQIPIQLSHSVAGELPLHKERRVFVLGQSTDQTLGCFVQSGRMFDGSVILPHPYVCVTRCMLVLSADEGDGDGGMLRSEVVAATSNRQLVYFEDGVVKDVCQLPFEQPEDVQLVNTGRNGCLFVVSFHQGRVCAVWKETFQIASQWSGVTSVHVDDFLRCGSDQMLLIFKDQSAEGQPLEEFLLTDLCGISYASGLSVLQELQREVRVKERVLRQSVQTLTDVVSDREPTLTQPEQEGLIALWDCDDESKQGASDDETQDMPAVPSRPRVDKLWHRIAEDRLVIGVVLTTDGSVPVANVSLSILTETSQSSTPAVIQTQSQVLRLPAPCSASSSSSSPASMFAEPAAKRSKQQHNAGRPNDLNTCRLAVTAVTRLTPLLNSGRVKCCVMLHYVQRRNAFALVSNPTPVTLHCGQVAFDIRSDFQTLLLKNPELKTDEVKEDLLSLMAVLDCWVFYVDSPDHSLGDVDGWIQKRAGCKRIEVSPQYLLVNSSGPSALMLLRWHQINPFQGELSVHSSQLQTLRFLDSLLAFLPESCSIRPVKGTNGQGVAQMLSLALEKEAASLREGVSSLLCEVEEEERKGLGHLEETPEPASVQGLQRCREVWQLDVERRRRMLSPLVDVARQPLGIYICLVSVAAQFPLVHLVDLRALI
ncbi:Fanconi anemia group B protein [Collichthys lucidus]|uniref:Fanconi anemia group B protein n=1 Tax=Collichthys lucidus TaxID=240159 RepID=A0A4U5TZH6_COLLU|nr:Fanconi anemia group B protein [Collichthys lucidus]